jgi:hypothetical protein
MGKCERSTHLECAWNEGRINHRKADNKRNESMQQRREHAAEERACSRGEERVGRESTQ